MSHYVVRGNEKMPDPADAFLLVFDTKPELYAWAVPFIREKIALFRSDAEELDGHVDLLEDIESMLKHEAYDDAIEAWDRFASDWSGTEGHFIVEETG